MRAIKFFVLLCLAVAPISAQAPLPPSQTTRVVDYPENEGVEIGNGWNSVLGKKTASNCIAFSVARDAGQDKSLDFRSVADKSAFADELEISAELQVKAIAFNVTGKSRFAKKTEIKDEFSNIVVHAIVQNGLEFVAPVQAAGTRQDAIPEATLVALATHGSAETKGEPPAIAGLDLPQVYSAVGRSIKLTPAAVKLARSDMPRFFNNCGDSFVAALQSGAELAALLTFKVRSVDDKQEISASLEGSGWGLQASVSTNSVISKYSESKQLSINYHQSGGSGDPLPTDQAGLLSAINTLPARAAAAPKPYRLTIQRYESLPNWPTEPQDISLAKVAEIASQFGKMNTLWADIDSILNQPGLYIFGRGVTEQSLKDLKDKIQEHLKHIENVAKKCNASGGSGCDLPKEDQIADYEYRIFLPAVAKSFPLDTQLRQQQADLKRQQEELAQMTVENCANDLLQRIPFLARDLAIHLCNAQLPGARQRKQQEITASQTLLTQLDGDYRTALRQAILQQWIQQANVARCRRDITSPDCLNNAQLDAYARKITIQ